MTVADLLKLAESALHHLDCVDVEPSDEDTDWERIQAARIELIELKVALQAL